jgi:hypothetical protein
MPPVVGLFRGIAPRARSVVGGRKAKQAKAQARVGGRFVSSARSSADPAAAGSGAVAASVSAGGADDDVQPLEGMARDDAPAGPDVAMQPCDGPAGLVRGESVGFSAAAVAVAGAIATDGAELLAQQLRLAADDDGDDPGFGAFALRPACDASLGFVSGCGIAGGELALSAAELMA